MEGVGSDLVADSSVRRTTGNPNVRGLFSIHNFNISALVMSRARIWRRLKILDESLKKLET